MPNYVLSNGAAYTGENLMSRKLGRKFCRGCKAFKTRKLFKKKNTVCESCKNRSRPKYVSKTVQPHAQWLKENITL